MQLSFWMNVMLDFILMGFAKLEERAGREKICLRWDSNTRSTAFDV